MTPKAISDVNRSERLIEDLREFSGMLLRDPKYRYAPQLMIDAADELARLRVDAERYRWLRAEAYMLDSRHHEGKCAYEVQSEPVAMWIKRPLLSSDANIDAAIDAALAATTPKQVADSSGRAEEEK